MKVNVIPSEARSIMWRVSNSKHLILWHHRDLFLFFFLMCLEHRKYSMNTCRMNECVKRWHRVGSYTVQFLYRPLKFLNGGVPLPASIFSTNFDPNSVPLLQLYFLYGLLPGNKKLSPPWAPGDKQSKLQLYFPTSFQ